MKSIPSGLQAVYDSGTATVAVAIKVTRGDGQVFAYTSADIPATISGTTYIAQGLGPSAFQSDCDFSVPNLTLSTLDDGTIFKRAEVIGGLWRNAVYTIFRYDYTNVGNGIDSISAGTFGEVRMLAGKVEIELRSLEQYLQQPVGVVTSKTCRARLGDARCTVDLTPYTVTGTVTSVADAQNFTASALSQADDYFGEGIVTWLTGSNAGQQQKVKTHTTGGVFQLSLPMLSAIQVGDTFRAVAGCRHRLIADCKTKFNNLLNFQGEPYMPGTDALTAAPDANV